MCIRDSNQDEQIIEELSKKDERLANDFKYLWKCASSPVYKNTDVKYYGCLSLIHI